MGKLTKTQLQLIAEGKSDSRRRVFVQTGFGTGSGRVRAYGSRRYDAAEALVAAGVLTAIDRRRTTLSRTGGRTEHFTDHFYVLTEA